MSRSSHADDMPRRPLTRAQKICGASALTVLGFAALGVVAGILIDRLMQFDSALDAGGEWDEGGGVSTRWY